MKIAVRAGIPLAVLILAGIAFVWFRGMQAGEEAPEAQPAPAEAPPPVETPQEGLVRDVPVVREKVTVPVLVDLSPETLVASERFRCVCGCPDILSACRCNQDPGGITMMNFLQSLVDRGLSNEAIDREMAARYGEEVLLFSPAHRARSAAAPKAPAP
ncbi:MAG: hypothetical protein HY509_00420 [Acidobacteria bacterium]|nr:hypothetical protein [Acidobacteriota bacterium]